MSDTKTNLIWLDLEMTGLDPTKDKVIEIATVVTDKNLEVVAVGPEIAIKQSDAVLDGMDEWNQRHHTGSGLVERVKLSQYTEQKAEQETLDFLKVHVDAKASPMCGNSICQDRRFLAAHLPVLEDFFHYRHIDVTTVKLLAMNWAPDLLKRHKKKGAHRAKEDVLESIAELKFYRDNFLKL